MRTRALKNGKDQQKGRAQRVNMRPLRKIPFLKFGNQDNDEEEKVALLEKAY